MRDDSEVETPCLTQLFGAAPFLLEHWPEKPLVSHGPLARLGALATIPGFERLESLLAAYGDQVRVALPDRRDEHSSQQVDARTAEKLYGQGLALILDRVNRFFPVIADWLEQLRLELSLPSRCEARAIVYATPAGGGNSPHFDANANFVVQLRGTKRWSMAPNEHVQHPTDRFAMNQTTMSEELEGYLSRPFPLHLPDDAQVIELVPGSVLFVPRGFWHATEAGGDTLALNFTFSQPTWADAALHALRTRLLQDGPWRELAMGEAGPQLLASLQEAVASITAADVREAIDGRPSYRLAEEAFLRVEEGEVLASIEGEALELELDERLYAVVEWIGEQRDRFSFAQVMQRFPELSSGLSGLIDLLVDKGVLHGRLQRGTTVTRKSRRRSPRGPKR